MNIQFTSHAWEEFNYGIENDQDSVKKIKELIKSIRQSPFKGIGKPEPLKHDLKGFWSRRISGEQSLVYKITGKKGVDQMGTIIQCRFHYDDK
jgi:toxin YoeB